MAGIDASPIFIAHWGNCCSVIFECAELPRPISISPKAERGNANCFTSAIAAACQGWSRGKLLDLDANLLAPLIPCAIRQASKPMLQPLSLPHQAFTLYLHRSCSSRPTCIIITFRQGTIKGNRPSKRTVAMVGEIQKNSSSTIDLCCLSYHDHRLKSQPLLHDVTDSWRNNLWPLTTPWCFTKPHL